MTFLVTLESNSKLKKDSVVGKVLLTKWYHYIVNNYLKAAARSSSIMTFSS
jgi:hypothetical protein